MKVNLLLIAVAVSMSSSCVLADEWYESYKPSINDPFGFGYVQGFSDYAQTKPLLEPFQKIGWKYPTQEKIYAVLTKSEVEAWSKEPTVVNSVELTTDTQVKTLADHFLKRGEEVSVPCYTGFIFSPVLSTAVDLGVETLLAYVNHEAKPTLEKAKQLSFSMAKGGKFSTYRAVWKNKKGQLLVGTSCVYDVTIGEELRSYLVYESVLAVKVAEK